MSTKRLLSVLKKDIGELSFGMFLRVARETIGISQAEMARKLGIARGTLCDIEKGRQLVSVSLAVRVAQKAGLSKELAVRACLQDQLNKAGITKRVELVA